MEIFLILVIIIVFAILLLFSVFWNLQNFPMPSGKYPVGTTELHLIDKNRKETNDMESNRELMLHIWYPAQQTDHTIPYELYNTDAIDNILEFMHARNGVPIWLLSALKRTKVHSKRNIPISTDGLFPVIIVSHGAGPMIQHYTSFCEELASLGYIVIGVNHPYMAAATRFPDGRVIKTLVGSKRKEGRDIVKKWKLEQFDVATDDIKFVLNSLESINNNHNLPLCNALNIQHVGMLGHSAGGSLTVRMCREDKRIKAGIALDNELKGSGAVAPFSTPTLMLLGQKSHIWAGHEGKLAYTKLEQLSQLPTMQIQIVSFKNIGHMAFSDVPLLLYTTLFGQLISYFIDVDVDASAATARKAQKDIKNHIAIFFNQYLK